jgi:hypothetical protein
MKALKPLVTGLLLVGSWASLGCAYAAISGVLHAYTAAYPAILGSHVPAFTKTTISVMQSAPAICLGGILLSVLLAGLAMGRAKSGESKLYWITVLGSINYYVAAFLTSTVLIGFFMLPKLANGA